MAYLGDDDETEQKNAQSGQDKFDISAPVSASQGGADQSSEENASDYAKSTGGGGTSSSNTPLKPNTNSTGLGSSTPGGGFVNFSAYENANPSSAGKISDAGQALLGHEQTNFANSTSVDPDSGFSSSPVGAPGNTLYDQVESLPSWATGGVDIGASIPTWDRTPGVVQDAAQNDPTQLGAWINETYTAPNYDYTPSENWQTQAPELSQTPGASGQTPSVVDYLARDNIKAGNYTPGERSLDQAIIAGDPAAQSAISGNKNLFGGFQSGVQGALGLLGSQVAQDQDLAGTISQTAGDQAGDLANHIMDAASSLAGQANGGTEQQRQDEARAFLNWYNSGGYNTGTFNQSNTPGSTATAAGALTPTQITELNNIAIAQGQPPPYPTAPQPNGAAGTYGFSIEPGPAAGAGPEDLPPPGSNQSQAGMNPTGLEQAAAGGIDLSPEQVQGMIGKVSTPDLQAIYGEWMKQEQQETDDGKMDAAAKTQKELDWISQILQGRQQTPSSLAASLGLTPADMAALGL